MAYNPVRRELIWFRGTSCDVGDENPDMCLVRSLHVYRKSFAGHETAPVAQTVFVQGERYPLRHLPLLIANMGVQSIPILTRYRLI